MRLQFIQTFIDKLRKKRPRNKPTSITDNSFQECNKPAPITDNPFQKKSYAQYGEDILIDTYKYHLNINDFSWLDIGAHHPEFINNTNLFYERGFRGINIDANPHSIREFDQKRPEDINLNILIGKDGKERTFYLMDSPEFSTMSKEEAQKRMKDGIFIKEEIILKTHTAQEIIDTYCNGVFPALLSIDVDGCDYEILQTINWEKSSPKIICAEIIEYSKDLNDNFDNMLNHKITKLLLSKNYCIMGYTWSNTLFVRKDILI